MDTLDYNELVEFRKKCRLKLEAARERRDKSFSEGVLKGNTPEFMAMVASHQRIENELTELTAKIFMGLLLEADSNNSKEKLVRATEKLDLEYKKLQDIKKVLSLLADFAELISVIITSISAGSIAKIGDILTRMDGIANSLGSL